MDIVSAFAAPRPVVLAGSTHWVRPITLDALATLHAWLDVRAPGIDERTTPPCLSDHQELLDSGEGLCVLVWLALRGSGHSWMAAVEVAAGMKPEEYAPLMDALFARRRTLVSTGDGEDIARLWWGKSVRGLAELLGGVANVGALTLDQFDLLADKDGCEDENPFRRRLTRAEVEEMARKARARKAAEQRREGVDP